MPMKLALAVRETVAGHRLGALEVGGVWHKALVKGGGGGLANPSRPTHPHQKSCFSKKKIATAAVCGGSPTAGIGVSAWGHLLPLLRVDPAQRSVWGFRRHPPPRERKGGVGR